MFAGLAGGPALRVQPTFCASLELVYTLRSKHSIRSLRRKWSEWDDVLPGGAQ